MTDTITLPREVVQEVLEALEHAGLNRGGIYTLQRTMLRTALAAEQPKPEPVAWRPRLSPNLCFHWSRPWSPGVPSEQTVDYWNQKGAGVEYAYAAPPALAAEQPSEDVEALRRDAERYRYLRDKAYVWDSDMPKAMRPVALWLHDVGNADIDAIINAAKENKR